MNDHVKAAPEAGCGPLIAPVATAQRPLRLQIFEMVRAFGSASRAEIAKELGISPGTVSTITADLIECGYLLDDAPPREPSETGRGRPPVALCARPGAFYVAGFKVSDLGRTGIVVDAVGTPLATLEVPRPTASVAPEAESEALCEAFDALLKAAGLTRAQISAVGIGVPGFVDMARGRVHWSPVFDRRDVDFANLVAERLGSDVIVDNDANLVALAELWFGIGRDKRDFAVVTVENGVGIGIVLENSLFRGAQGLGLELAHTKVQIDGALCRCGQRGCLEAYISDYALAREAGAALGALSEVMPPIPDLLERLYEEARGGNGAARSIFRRAGRYLAVGLANVVNLFDPSLIIISGDRMRYDYLYAEDTLAEMRHFALDTSRPLPPIEVHAWGTLLWAHGAAALALSTATEGALGAGA